MTSIEPGCRRGGVVDFVEDRIAEEPPDSPWPAAVRRIVGLYRASVERDAWMRDFMGAAPLATVTAAYREAVQALALRWRGHPGFDPDWGPRSDG